jgi:short-subunit dehydrogenase
VLDSYADRWALVTGASSGIGAEFARVLASRGMHLILTARRADRLTELAQELDTRHGTRTEIITQDLSETGGSKRLFDEIQKKSISIELLINNAGFGHVGIVEETDPERMQRLVQLNIAAVTDLTFRFLPQMIANGHGGIINVSSVAAFQPVAYMPTYSASKAFVLHFSEALWAECRDKGVTILGLCPGTTETEFFDVAGINGWLKKHRAHTVDYVVKKALKALEKKRQYVIPGFVNFLLSLGVRIARRKMVVKQSMRFFRPRTSKAEEEKKAKNAAQEEAPTDSQE